METPSVNLVPGAMIVADERDEGVYVVQEIRRDYVMETVNAIVAWLPAEGDPASAMTTVKHWDFREPQMLVDLVPNWDRDACELRNEREAE